MRLVDYTVYKVKTVKVALLKLEKDDGDIIDEIVSLDELYGLITDLNKIVTDMDELG